MKAHEAASILGLKNNVAPLENHLRTWFEADHDRMECAITRGTNTSWPGYLLEAIPVYEKFIVDQPHRYDQKTQKPGSKEEAIKTLMNRVRRDLRKTHSTPDRSENSASPERTFHVDINDSDTKEFIRTIIVQVSATHKGINVAVKDPSAPNRVCSSTTRLPETESNTGQKRCRQEDHCDDEQHLKKRQYVGAGTPPPAFHPDTRPRRQLPNETRPPLASILHPEEQPEEQSEERSDERSNEQPEERPEGRRVSPPSRSSFTDQSPQYPLNPPQPQSCLFGQSTGSVVSARPEHSHRGPDQLPSLAQLISSSTAQDLSPVPGLGPHEPRIGSHGPTGFYHYRHSSAIGNAQIIQ